MELEEAVEDATGNERIELIHELRVVKRILDEDDAHEDEVTAEWDAMLDRGEKPDLWSALPEWVKKRMGSTR